ncbi:MAG: nicotinate phosphoribosyltransferase [Blastocatellia bacterium]|nr:nicotinate phosphoribosyltransferase [Blastocatellia bacterium]
MTMIERVPGLVTDLYELTMAAAYYDNRMEGRAVFDLFVRRLPENRSFLLAAGLEQALDYLYNLEFTAEQIDYVRRHPSFKNVSREFFDYLADFRFTGDVWAVPEGTAVFGMEPMARVEAPIIEAQIVETFLLSTINFQTMIASKAARVVTAAEGRAVIEFGTRRAHGTEAGLFAARAAYIAGCQGTSNVEAGYLFGIPTFGTLAHSFVMLFDEEDDAFRAFLKVFPDTATLLVDTYDTLAAVKRLTEDFEADIPSIRLDSGDMCQLSIEARRILDEAGRSGTKIFASGDLNEYRIADLISRGACIDAFGVGTEMATSYDRPALSGVYKLAGLSRDGRMSMKIKMSPDKSTCPGPKQVWRLTSEEGKHVEDVIALADEDKSAEGAAWKPLLELVMRDGRPTDERLLSTDAGESNSAAARSAGCLARLNEARARASEELKRLPAELLSLNSETRYRVKFSERLAEEKRKLEEEITADCLFNLQEEANHRSHR